MGAPRCGHLRANRVNTFVSLTYIIPRISSISPFLRNSLTLTLIPRVNFLMFFATPEKRPGNLA